MFPSLPDTFQKACHKAVIDFGWLLVVNVFVFNCFLAVKTDFGSVGVGEKASVILPYSVIILTPSQLLTQYVR